MSLVKISVDIDYYSSYSRPFCRILTPFTPIAWVPKMGMRHLAVKFPLRVYYWFDFPPEDILR